MKVNGEMIAAADGITVRALLDQLGYLPSRIAVEVNGAIVPKSQYDAYVLHDTDTLEIVCFMGGG